MNYGAFVAGNGKNVIITETGRPNIGTPFGGSSRSYENAIKYFINAQKWQQMKTLNCFIFLHSTKHGKSVMKEMWVHPGVVSMAWMVKFSTTSGY